MHPPLAMTGARMYGFWAKGNLQSLQASIDGTLNAASASQMRFTVVTSYVLLTFTQVTRAYSTDPVDKTKGWGRETDIVTWVMVARTDAGNAWPAAFYACPLHIWVDDCMALINGRELFGYPKYECRYQMPSADGPATGFRLAAKGFQPFSEGTELAMHPLLDVDAVGASPQPESFVSAPAWRASQLEILGTKADFWAADPAWQADFEKSFSLPALNQIFIKQFPDASGQYAVYQALVSAPAQVKSILRLEMLYGEYELTLHEFASFPLHKTLGWILSERQPMYACFRVDYDFEVGDGAVLVDNCAAQDGRSD